MRILLACLAMLLAGPSHASTELEILNENLIGFSTDGRVAYQHSAGFLSEIPNRRWSASYVVVLNAQTGKVVDHFQIGATTSTAKLSPRDWKIYSKAKPAASWATEQKNFTKPNAELSNGVWMLDPTLVGDKAELRKQPAEANGSGRLVTERVIPGTVLAYEVAGPRWMEDSGKWKLKFDVVSGHRTITLHSHKLWSKSQAMSGNPEGFFASYWTPGGVALEWTYEAMVGGGEWTEFFYHPLPK
jgi:hypothetical protein